MKLMSGYKRLEYGGKDFVFYSLAVGKMRVNVY